MSFVPCLFQHMVIEPYPTQFAVDVKRGGIERWYVIGHKITGRSHRASFPHMVVL